MMQRAHFLLFQVASAARHTKGSPPASEIVALIVAGVLFLACAVTAVLVVVLRARKTDDGDDDSGPGRRGPEPPRGDPGPSGGDPAWWPDFEREFAGYVEATARRKTDRVVL